MNPNVTAFFDESTHTVSYVVSDPGSTACAIIDSVLDYDAASGRVTTASADRIIDFVRSKRFRTDWILETHIHADHLTAAPYLQKTLGGKTAIGAGVAAVQNTFATVFNVEADFPADGSQFDHLLTDDEHFAIGGLHGRAMHTPGHTEACMTYVIGDAAFVGDTLFMPDYGTARTDFPGGDAATLYRSIQEIFALPGSTRLFLCHDYKAPGRDEFHWESTVDNQRRENVHLRGGVSEQDFVTFRNERDTKLSLPTLLLPSVQINIRAGNLPPAEDNGTHYLKIPVNEEL